MAILAFMGLVLLASGAPDAEDPDLCTTDPAPIVRPEAEPGGVTAEYALQVSGSVDRFGPFLARLDPARYAVTALIDIGENGLVVLVTKVPASVAAEVRGEVKTLCGFRQYGKGRLTLHARLNDRERAWRAPPKPPVVYDALPPPTGAAPATPVTREEVDALIRDDGYIRDQFLDVPDPSLKLGPVRELMCRLQDDRQTHECRVRLPIIRQGEPRYAEFRGSFVRAPDGGLTFLFVLDKGRITEERPPSPASAPSANSGD